MRRPVFVRVVLLASPLFVFAASAGAQPAQSGGPEPHVRPDAMLKTMLHDAERRSSAVRDLVDRLDRSDVVVYVRLAPPSTFTFSGRLRFLSRTPVYRYLVVELPCGRSAFEQMAMLGHELRHAVEIAEAASVVDLASLSIHYQRIGMQTSGLMGVSTTFETKAAMASGRQVWREVMENARRTVDEY
jgi:hypothetical protein